MKSSIELLSKKEILKINQGYTWEELMEISDEPWVPFEELLFSEEHVKTIVEDYIQRFGSVGILDNSDYQQLAIQLDTESKLVWYHSIVEHIYKEMDANTVQEV